MRSPGRLRRLPVHMLRKLFKTVYIYAWIVLVTTVLGSYLILRALMGRNERLAHRVAGRWARSILWVTGVKVEIEGLEHLDPAGSYILMPNHQSHFDIPVLLGCLQCEFRWLAKAELFKIPIFGKAMRNCGYISIDRTDRQAAFESIRQAGEKICNGVSVLIFPEGTRSSDGRIRSFKKGGFVLAVDSGATILPMGIYGTRRILPKKTLLMDPGPVTLCIQPPIETRGFSRETKEGLMEAVRGSICEAYTRASRGQASC